MLRKIIKIDENKCDGCGLCVNACHEGAIVLVNNKAKLMRDDYCDGLGDCLPACPQNAISFEEREALAYDEEAVKKHLENKKKIVSIASIQPSISINKNSYQSALTNWPVQIQLAPIQAPYLQNANLLIAADCTAYAYANFHQDFIKNHITLIGCPKLDSMNYSDKLTQILIQNNILSITVIRMEVPCCKGIDLAVTNAIASSKKFIPYTCITITKNGQIKS